MPTIRIPPGVVRGETRAMVPGRWHIANLIRWVEGIMQPVRGHVRLTGVPLASIPRNIHVFVANGEKRIQGVICDDNIYYEVGGVYREITPADFEGRDTVGATGYGTGRYGLGAYGRDNESRDSALAGYQPFGKFKSSLANWNTELLFSASTDKRLFFCKTEGSEPAGIVPNAPTGIQDFMVTDEKHVMVFGVKDFPNRIAWSDRENRNGWDFANVTGQAGFFDLQDAGTIICAVKLTGGILVFTTTSIWFGQYLGSPFYYSFRQIHEGAVPISAHSIVVIGNRVYWMGSKSFYKFEGGLISPLSHPLGSDFFDNIDERANVCACAGANGLYPEAWFYFPSKRADTVPTNQIENDRYAVFGYQDGMQWWADGFEGRTCYVPSSVDQSPLAGTVTRHIMQHEKGMLADGASRIGQIYAEVGSLSFDDGQTVFSVHQAQIDNATGPEAVAFDFKGQYARGGQVYTFHEGLRGRADGYLDTKFAARDFSMRVKSAVDSMWAMGALVFHKVRGRGGR